MRIAVDGGIGFQIEVRAAIGEGVCGGGGEDEGDIAGTSVAKGETGVRVCRERIVRIVGGSGGGGGGGEIEKSLAGAGGGGGCEKGEEEKQRYS